MLTLIHVPLPTDPVPDLPPVVAAVSAIWAVTIAPSAAAATASGAAIIVTGSSQSGVRAGGHGGAR